MNETNTAQRAAEARRTVQERFVAANQETPPPPQDPVAIPAFLTHKSFRWQADGTLVVSLLVPPHMAQESYVALIPYCRDLPLAVSLEPMSPELLATIAEVPYA